MGKFEEFDSVVVRFAGDSGDGMQLVGSQFTTTCAMMGDDVATLPDFPSEIRAPAGTVFGVSGYQVCFGNGGIFTPGDKVDVLVAMNPAALKTNLQLMKPKGLIIVNEDAFTARNLEKAGYTASPLEGDALADYRVCRVKMGQLTQKALEGSTLSPKQVDRCKNFAALGVTYALFHRSRDSTDKWLQKKFGAKPDLLEANVKAFEAGVSFGASGELFPTTYRIRKRTRSPEPGNYRQVTGNSAAALGLIAAARRANLPLFLGSYPITPATDILHELSKHRNIATIFQAEDEIAAAGATLGAAFGGSLAVTTTSGPGFSLKSEFINLAVMVELPMIVINVQRAGPSTGLPTKTEQSDLLQALWGRHGESPIAVIAASSPRDCFDATVEAARIALKYMTPVILLSDGYLGNGAEVWRVPALEDLPDLRVTKRTDPENFLPYGRDPETLARPWVVPGTPGLEHRIGGLEKADGTGTVSHDPENHEKMVRLRAEKIARIARDLPPTEVLGDPRSELLVLGWGSTQGVIRRAVENLNAQGTPVACAHLRHLNPLPSDLGTLLRKYKKVLIPENNMGQLWYRIRAEYLLDIERLNKVQGQPFRADEIEAKIKSMLSSGAQR
ncbi:MAG: 2-oxoacid:acceptor oxidoreductase subunit alpha [Oligoflexia bacterium]|nr:2-oxoacid:acceptor oxidoreductase subunit alpha [Oligoflexia bacterium]